MKSTVNITLKEIIKRKICYFKNDGDQELAVMNAGYLRGFTETLADMNLPEQAFTTKYLSILKNLKPVFKACEDSREPETNIEELGGYNNAIVDILRLLNEKYLYEQAE